MDLINKVFSGIWYAIKIDFNIDDEIDTEEMGSYELIQDNQPTFIKLMPLWYLICIFIYVFFLFKSIFLIFFLLLCFYQMHYLKVLELDILRKGKISGGFSKIRDDFGNRIIKYSYVLSKSLISILIYGLIMMFFLFMYHKEFPFF